MIQKILIIRQLNLLIILKQKKTETPFVPFAVDENFDVIISADNLGNLSDHVIIDADNYITRTYAKKPISTVNYCF